MDTCLHTLHDNFPYNSPGGGGVALVMRLTHVHLVTLQRYSGVGGSVESLLSEKFVGNVVTCVRIRQAEIEFLIELDFNQ